GGAVRYALDLPGAGEPEHGRRLLPERWAGVRARVPCPLRAGGRGVAVEAGDGASSVLGPEAAGRVLRRRGGSHPERVVHDAPERGASGVDGGHVRPVARTGQPARSALVPGLARAALLRARRVLLR